MESGENANPCTCRELSRQSAQLAGTDQDIERKGVKRSMRSNNNCKKSHEWSYRERDQTSKKKNRKKG